MKRKISVVILILVLAYFVSYIWFRQSNDEVWEKDGNAYIIFPTEQIYLHYFYRPLTYLDGNLTGMKFHIGQHR